MTELQVISVRFDRLANAVSRAANGDKLARDVASQVLAYLTPVIDGRERWICQHCGQGQPVMFAVASNGTPLVGAPAPIPLCQLCATTDAAVRAVRARLGWRA